MLKGYSQYDYIINGISNGFAVGIDKSKTQNSDNISSSSKFCRLTRIQRNAVTSWINKGLEKEFISGPYDLDYNFSFGKLYLAPLFVIPKPDGKWRTIVHLSFKLAPHMYTINDLLFHS